MTTEPTWDELVERLAEARQRVAQTKEARKKIEEAIEAQFGEALKQNSWHQEDAMELMERCAYDLRAAAVQAFETVGDKHPHPAVSVGVYMTLQYEEADALEYCREHAPKALKLNKRAFEKVAKVIEPGFVTFVAEARARIARDLSAYVTAEEDVSP